MELSSDKKELVRLFMDRGVLLSPEFVDQLSAAPDEQVKRLLAMITENGPLIMNKDIEEFISSMGPNHNLQEFERMWANVEKKGHDHYEKMVSTLKTENQNYIESSKRKKVEVLYSYEDSEKKRDMNSFVAYFTNRYNTLKKILQHRQEFEKASSINRVKMRREKDAVSIIGLVKDKSTTKNGAVVITLEDTTGEINVMVTKSKPELYDLTAYVVLDEVIGVTGTSSYNSSSAVIFANSITFPDIPSHELKKSPDDENIAVLGDIHMGSKHFLYDEFNRMIKWLKGEFGSQQQKEDAKKIRYLILIGDLVDGVGIYPSQEKDLEINDITKQYDLLASYLQKVPEDINIIICAGNHDAVRLAEPQSVLPKDFAKSLWDMPNVTMVSNPAVLNLGATEDFPGFTVLLYHGFSFPYYADSVEPLRLKGGLENVNAIMEFLLKKRHLAPSHSSTQYIPDEREDPLVIKYVPDIFISGHIHTTSITNYKNITLVNSSSWIGMTDFQEKVGLHPHPARVPIINLKTRQAKVMRFESDN